MFKLINDLQLIFDNLSIFHLSLSINGLSPYAKIVLITCQQHI